MTAHEHHAIRRYARINLRGTIRARAVLAGPDKRAGALDRDAVYQAWKRLERRSWYTLPEFAKRVVARP